MDDPRLADVEQYHGRLRSELDVIARGPVLVGPKIIEHIHSLITLIDLHQPNEFDLCLSCDRLWPCASIMAITGVSQDAEPGSRNDEVEPDYAESGADSSARAAAADTGRPPPPPVIGYDDRERSRDSRTAPEINDQRVNEPRFDDQRPDDRRFDDQRPAPRSFDDRRPADRRFDDHGTSGRHHDGRALVGRRRDDRGLEVPPDAGQDRGNVPPPGPGYPPAHVAAPSRQPAMPGTRPAAGPPPAAHPGPPPSAPGRPAGPLPAVAAHGGIGSGDADRPLDRARDGYTGYPPAAASAQPTAPRPTGPAPRVPPTSGRPHPNGALPRLPGMNDPGRRPAAEVGSEDRSAGRHYAAHPNGTAAHPNGTAAHPNGTAAHPTGGASNLPGTAPPSPGPPQQPGAPGFAPAPAAGGSSPAQPWPTGAFPIAGDAGRERSDEFGSALPGLAPPTAGGRSGPPADVPARPTGAQPRFAAGGATGVGGQPPDRPPDAVPNPTQPVDHSVPPGYAGRVSVPASRPAPPISGPVEMASARASGTRAPHQQAPHQQAPETRAGDPAARGPVEGSVGDWSGPPRGLDVAGPAGAGRPDAPRGPGRPNGPGGPGRAEDPRMRATSATAQGHAGPRLAPGRGGDVPPERRSTGWRTDGDLPGHPEQGGPGWPGPDPRERRPRGQASQPDRAGPPTGAPPPNGRSPYTAPTGGPGSAAPDEGRPGGPGRGRPIGAGGSSTPNLHNRGPGLRPGRPSREESPRRPGGEPDRPGPGSEREAELSAAAARIDQAQVDEVTQAWLARRGSVLDGIDVI
ncbi:hypothetical protein [Frankia tisae]|uniref:hypothetical protein n=1 Tax=Frankia tisae TaxID=2950104 RepID=UPI0021C16191|nr:hypothetical protein [Frankia tisae]